MKQQRLLAVISAACASALYVGTQVNVSLAQDMLPGDNGLFTYHSQPRYRESESHPLRILAYVLHPIGWLAREAVARPLSYLAGSTETTRSVFGYREPYDFRSPECFAADESIPDCRSVAPFNYEGPSAVMPSGAGEEKGSAEATVTSMAGSSGRDVYFPDVNFDFNKHALSDLGQGQVRRVAGLLKTDGGVHVVLQGNADYKGSEKYNEKLGMDRAEAVRSELVSLGVPADRLSTVTFGESQPVFSDETDWARAVNRRVEVHLDSGEKAK